MVEIIRRKKKEAQEKSQIKYNHPQISFNSDGHLVVRLIDGDNDNLIVFDRNASNEVIRFCQSSLSNKTLLNWFIPED